MHALKRVAAHEAVGAGGVKAFIEEPLHGGGERSLLSRCHVSQGRSACSGWEHDLSGHRCADGGPHCHEKIAARKCMRVR